MIHIEFNPHKEDACQRIGCMLVKMDNISLMLQQEIETVEIMPGLSGQDISNVARLALIFVFI